jgi:hypothetical protein
MRRGKRRERAPRGARGAKQRATLEQREAAAIEAAQAVEPQPKNGAWCALGQNALDEALRLACGGDEGSDPAEPPKAWPRSERQARKLAQARSHSWKDGEFDAERYERERQALLEQDRLRVCEQLLRRGANPRAHSQAALVGAVRLGSVRLAERLIEAGARVAKSQAWEAWAERTEPNWRMWASLAKKGAEREGQQASYALYLCVVRCDRRGARAMIALRKDRSAGLREAMEKACRHGQTFAAGKESADHKQRREEFFRWLAAQPGADERGEWPDLGDAAASRGAPAAAAPFALAIGGSAAAQSMMWSAWREDNPEAMVLALKAGADPGLPLPKESAEETPAARRRRARPHRAGTPAWSMLAGLSLRQAIESEQWSHMGRRAAAALRACDERAALGLAAQEAAERAGDGEGESGRGRQEQGEAGSGSGKAGSASAAAFREGKTGKPIRL